MEKQEINVFGFENRADLMKKKLMVFLNQLQKNYEKTTGKKDINLLALTVEMKTVRKYVEVIAGNPSIQFTLGTQNLQKGETALDNSDAFIPIEMAFGFSKVPTGQVIANNEIYQYPDKTVFDDNTVGASPVEWKALLSYYWGTWSLAINNKTITSEFHAERLLKVAQLQETSPSYMAYQQEGRFTPEFNNPLLDGNKTIQYTFTPVSNADTKNAAGKPLEEKNYAVLDVRGFVVKDMSTALNALNSMYYWVS